MLWSHWMSQKSWKGPVDEMLRFERTKGMTSSSVRRDVERLATLRPDAPMMPRVAGRARAPSKTEQPAPSAASSDTVAFILDRLRRLGLQS